MARLVILRPEPGAEATADKARKQGLEASAVPLFGIEKLDWDGPDPSHFDGLLLTSANAVRQAGEKLKDYRGLQAYAVGEATAEAARDAGFGIASTGSAGIDRLLGSIDADVKLLHLCGEGRHDPEQAKQHITSIPVYRASPVPNPALGDLCCAVVLVHSPRAGARFGQLVKDRSNVTIAAISEAAASSVGDGWKAVETAEQPGDDALLALAARLCNKP